MPGPPVTLEILVCPADLGYVGHTLPHQLRVLGPQVDEVVFVLDAVPPSHGRFAGGWGDALPRLEALLADLTTSHPDARVARTRGTPEELTRLGARWFGGETIPTKDCRGLAFEAYVLGLDAPRHDHVLHVDGDMLLGGGSPTWVTEATAVLAADPDVVSVIPLSGPPHPDGVLHGQGPHERYPHATPAYRFPNYTTRIGLVDRRRLLDRLAPLPLSRPPHKRTWLRALRHGHPLVGMPEDILWARTVRAGMHRVDLLGRDPGLWTLHPSLKPPEFLERLPELVARVESGDVPDAQLGHYDIVDALVDQTEARRRQARQRWR